jgi:hypothetical protein
VEPALPDPAKSSVASGLVAKAGSHERNPAIASRDKVIAGRRTGYPEVKASATNVIAGRVEMRDNYGAPVSLLPGIPRLSRAERMGAERISPSVGIGIQASRPQSVKGKGVKWMIFNSGTLFQSFDGGVRWQSVTVDQNVELRAVSAQEDEVWVGGTSGKLFQSSDNGRHWTKVVPSAAGTVLRDDIERVEFKDANNSCLTITTKPGNTWVTTDHGQTWEIHRP